MQSAGSGRRQRQDADYDTGSVAPVSHGGLTLTTGPRASPRNSRESRDSQ